jgi:hypothetical protein
VGGVTLPLAVADLGLLFAGLSERLDLTLVGRQEFGVGAVALRYQPRRITP